jgi:hypothetical protein
MMEAEYKCAAKLAQDELINLPKEDEYLGLDRFKVSHILAQNKKTETMRYRDELVRDITYSIVNSDNYLTRGVTFVPPKHPLTKAEKECKCLGDFYLQHSACS